MNRSTYFSSNAKVDYTFWSKGYRNSRAFDQSEIPYCQGRKVELRRYGRKDKSLSAFELKNHDKP